MFLCNNRFWGCWSLCFKKSSCGCSRGISKPSYCRKWCPGCNSMSKKCFKASELGLLYKLWLKKLWTWCIRILLTSLNSNGLIGLAVLLPRWDCRITQQGSVHLGRTAYVYGAPPTPPTPPKFFFLQPKKKTLHVGVQIPEIKYEFIVSFILFICLFMLPLVCLVVY